MKDPNNKKRARDDSDLDSPESKRVNSESPESINSVLNSPESEPVSSYCPESVNSEVNSPESTRIPEGLLDILDDSDPASQDLDSVIKSFEEEILHHPSPTSSPPQAAVVHQSSEPGESLPELGYLLEASDDELGLPPTIAPSGDQTASDPIEFKPIVPFIPAELEGMVGFEDDIPSYNSFGFGIVGEARDNGDMNSEFVTLGGWFDYSDESDYSEFLWQPESLPPLYS